MQIDNKFNLGETVYFMQNNSIVISEIVKIEIVLRESEDPQVTYLLSDPYDRGELIKNVVMYKSLDEILQQLKKDFEELFGEESIEKPAAVSLTAEHDFIYDADAPVRADDEEEEFSDEIPFTTAN